MPEPVRKDIGVALDIAQHGEKPNAAKALRGFGGAGVLEIVDDYDGDTPSRRRARLDQSCRRKMQN